MKVSKLFHWLYAILMLMPFIVFLFSMIFNNFNAGNITDIVDTIYNQFSDIWSLPLFEWAKSSFLVAPFNYLGSLFGLASDNLITVCLDYWLCITILWLCFDLIMYVPNLVHKWIDKAGVE